MPGFLAAAADPSTTLWGALGLNWWSLAVDALAFLVVAAILSRYVYPHLLKALDKKADEFESAGKLKSQAEQALGEAAQEAKRILTEARTSADEIITTANTRSKALLQESEQKAAAQAERIITQGREQLARDLLSARRSLKEETAQLVALATRALLSEKLDREADMALIGRGLDEGEE